MSGPVIIWVLSFTILGNMPEHGNIAKYSDKESCEQALKIKRQEVAQSKKILVGSCKMKLS